MSDESVSVVDKLIADRRSLDRAATGAVVIDKAQQMTRRLERRKLQRNRTAFTQRQIEELEKVSIHQLYSTPISLSAPINPFFNFSVVLQ